MNRRFALIALTLLALATLACYESGSYRTSPLITPTATLDPFVAALVIAGQAEIEAERVSSLATAQAVLSLATVEAARAAAADARAQYEAQAAATAEAINARATIQALEVQATAAAFSLAATRTAAAQQATATAQAASERATATAEAQRVTATAEAQQATATAQAGHLTATAVAFSVQATSQTLAAQATYQAAELEREQMALQRERITQPLRTWWPWLVVVALTCLTLATLVWAIPRLGHLLALRASRSGGQNGDKPTYNIPAFGGFLSPWTETPRLLTYDPDRDSGPGQIIDATVQEPGPLPSGDPTVTRNDQLLDALTRSGPPSAAHTGRRVAVARQIASPPPYRILDPHQPPPPQLMDRETAQVLDAEWEEVRNE